MLVRRPSLILALAALPALLPALAACGNSVDDGPPPPSKAAEAAIRDDGGASHAPLGRAIDALFDDEAVGKTRALLIMKRGSIIVERYAHGASASSRLPGWSMGQCLTALMIGQLVSDGRMRLDDTATIPAWQRIGDPRGEITVRQLLQMRSGLRHVENTKDISSSDRFRMLFLDGRDDLATYAEAQPLEAPAGQVFAHSTATGIILNDLAAHVLSEQVTPAARRDAVDAYLRKRVLEPSGMTDTYLPYDRAGTLLGSSMVRASTRDWGKLGELIRHNGSVKGAQILPRRWIQFMLAPSPRNPGYGAGVWLNRAASGETQQSPVTDIRNPLFPNEAPVSLFGCIGEQGQYLLGSPDQLLTVVRLGETGTEQQEALHRRLGDLLALFPGYR